MTTTRTIPEPFPDPDLKLPFISAGAPGHMLCLVCMKGGSNWEFRRNWVHMYSDLTCPNCGAVEDRSLGSNIRNFMAGAAYEQDE